VFAESRGIRRRTALPPQSRSRAQCGEIAIGLNSTQDRLSISARSRIAIDRLPLGTDHLALNVTIPRDVVDSQLLHTGVLFCLNGQCSAAVNADKCMSAYFGKSSKDPKDGSVRPPVSIASKRATAPSFSFVSNIRAGANRRSSCATAAPNGRRKSLVETRKSAARPTDVRIDDWNKDLRAARRSSRVSLLR
jgi:hypothetical protein